jgi:hypothetical protein
MAEETVTAPATTEPTMGNDPAARTPEGAIKDVQTATPASDPAAKPAEAKPAEGTKKPDPAAVPEKYEFKPAEGTELDTKLIESVTPLFKELGLSQEGAQKLFDFHNAAVKAAVEGPANVMNEMRTEWRGEVVKDPTLGNGTDNLKPEVRANIAKAIESVGDAKAVASFKEAMDLTGAGDNPALIRGLNAIGKLLSEGTLVRGGTPSPLGQTKSGETSRPSPAQAMYPSLPSSAQS